MSTSRHTASFLVRNRYGLHARAARQLAETATRFEARITVQKDGRAVDCKSILELLLLEAVVGSRLEIEAQGVDAEAAVQALGELIENLFGESE